MNPPEISSSESREKWMWMWVLVLASPIYLTLIGFVLFSAIPPSDLLLRNLVIFLLIVLGFGVLFLISRLATREVNKNVDYFKRQMELTNRIAPSALTPESLQLMQLLQPPKRSRRSIFLRLATAVLIWLGLFWLITQAMPAWSGALNGITGLVVGLLVYLAWDLVEGIFRNAHESKRPIPWSTIAAILAGLIIVGLGGILLSTVLQSWAKRLEAIPILLLFGFVVLALVFLPMGWDVLVGEYVRRPLRQLDYAHALARALRVEKRIHSSTWKSIVLLYMGQPEEAEAVIRQSFPRVRRSLLIADSFVGWLEENRGYSLVEQKRYAEAITAFQNGLVFNPKDSDRLTALAETYLRQGIEPQRALDLTDRSLKHRQPPIINRLFMRNSVGELKANHAWALAMAGRYEEARETLEQALKEYDRSSKLSAASMYWRAGHVLRLRGDERAAREHFARAIEIDPDGNYGRLARQMLAEQEPDHVD